MTDASRRAAGRWAEAPDPVPPQVQVLVTTRDRPAELAVTLAGLASQDDPVFGVVVSDQSDGDLPWCAPAVAAMVRVLRAQGRSVTLLRHRPRLGLAEHRQFLLDQATADAVLYLDDDVWLEPGALATMHGALRQLGCGFVGMAVQGLSFLADDRPAEREPFEVWDGPVQPEVLRRDRPGFGRWTLHNAANLAHQAADLRLPAGQWRPYKVAWIGGCVLYRRSALVEAGGYGFWRDLPSDHVGEDVTAQWRVMERFGGAGLVPSGAVHIEAPTTLPVRAGDAFDVVFPEPRESGAEAPPAVRGTRPT